MMLYTGSRLMAKATVNGVSSFITSTDTTYAKAVATVASNAIHSQSFADKTTTSALHPPVTARYTATNTAAAESS